MGKEINYLIGDATVPQAEGNKIIVHICNDIGAWGKGFVLALSNRWKQPEIEYRKWHKSRQNFALGEIQLVKVEENIVVANMIGQRGVKQSFLFPPIRYGAVNDCLAKVTDVAISTNASIHMPRIGCGLAGGQWAKIEQLIITNFTDKGIPVFVYDLELTE